MPSSFLYILLQEDDGGKVKDPATDKSKDDCACDQSVNANRLPSQDDLVQSEQYMQDVGGSCVNLTTPNRSLREYSYSALVRHTDPDVSSYVLVSETDPDPLKAKTVYKLQRVGKVRRNMVDLDNPIKWEDAEDDQASLNVYQVSD